MDAAEQGFFMLSFPANERIAEFLDAAIQTKFAYVNKLQSQMYLFLRAERRN